MDFELTTSPSTLLLQEEEVPFEQELIGIKKGNLVILHFY